MADDAQLVEQRGGAAAGALRVEVVGVDGAGGDIGRGAGQLGVEALVEGAAGDGLVVEEQQARGQERAEARGVGQPARVAGICAWYLASEQVALPLVGASVTQRRHRETALEPAQALSLGVGLAVRAARLGFEAQQHADEDN